jgi:hypothetical protein
MDSYSLSVLEGSSALSRRAIPSRARTPQFQQRQELNCAIAVENLWWLLQAFYGSDNTRASKVAVGIVAEENAEPVMARWYSDKTDVRRDPRIGEEILQYFQTNAVKSVVVTEDMLGCPHEEGIHYPEGGICPQCPFWANRDRFSSEIIH